MAEGQSLGKKAFLAKYGSLDACIEANAAQAQSILDSCRSASQPAACVAQQLGISRRASDNRGRDAAAKLCLAELKKLGEQAFKAKYGSHDACLEQRQQQAQQLEQNCAAAQDPKACLRDALEQRGRKPDPNAVARAKERCRRAADRGACAEAILKSGRKRGK
jgi:hypothetical protein